MMKDNLLIILLSLISFGLSAQIQINTIETSFQPFLSSKVKIEREYESTASDLNSYKTLSYRYSIQSKFTFRKKYQSSLGISYTHYNYSFVVNFEENYMKKIGWAETDYFSVLKNFVSVWEIGVNPTVHYYLLDKERNKLLLGCGIDVKYPLKASGRGSLSYESTKVFEFSGKVNKNNVIFISPNIQINYEKKIKTKFWIAIKFQYVPPLYRYFTSTKYTIYSEEILSGNFHTKDGGISIGLGLIYRINENFDKQKR